MSAQEIQRGLYQIRLPGVNAFLLDSKSDGLTLVDTGMPGSADRIAKAVRSLGRDLTDIRHILVTHCHADHSGSLAELKARTSARVFMHRSDARLVETGKVMRRLTPSPGILNAVMYRLVVARKPTVVTPATTDEFVDHGDEIPVAGGISVIHTPGHTAGHVVFRARERGIAFLGDAAANFFGLRLMFAHEHVQQGVMSLRHLCRYDFEVACFGHGPSILEGAANRFRQRWAARGSVAGRRRGL